MRNDISSLIGAGNISIRKVPVPKAEIRSLYEALVQAVEEIPRYHIVLEGDAQGILILFMTLTVWVVTLYSGMLVTWKVVSLHFESIIYLESGYTLIVLCLKVQDWGQRLFGRIHFLNGHQGCSKGCFLSLV